MKSTFKIALGGVMAAFCIVLMLLTAIVPIGSFALPCIAGLILLMVSYEVGISWAILIYAAVAIMSLLFVADKESALLFTMFLGYYPILKEFLDKKIRNKAINYIVKFAVFNVCAVSGFFIGVYLLGIPKEGFEINGIYLPWLFLIIGEVAFFIYEICLSRIRVIYLPGFRDRIFHRIK